MTEFRGYHDCPECGQLSESFKEDKIVYLECSECGVRWILCPDCGEWIDAYSDDWSITEQKCFDCVRQEEL